MIPDKHCDRRILFGGVHFLIASLLSVLLLQGCAKKSHAEEKKNPDGASYRIAIFIPGLIEGSAIYGMLVEGTERAVSEYDYVRADIVEGGFNQAEWQQKITAIAATGSYDLIISSNPAIPAICVEVSRDFPDQKFAVMDSYLSNHPHIYTLLFNQMEQAYLVGYMGGLVTESNLPGANRELRVGFIAGQRYPLMDRAIRPGFEAGLKAVNPHIRTDFRIVGNWYDANKAAELAYSMIDTGVDIILTIAGSANQGVIKSAQERNSYVLWFDSSGYEVCPGTVLGSGILKNDRAAYETVKQAIEGKLPFGKPKIVGIEDGYVDFDQEDEIYIKTVPVEIRERMGERITLFKSGTLRLNMPDLEE